jgi:beta-glucanase (GH16 family)
VLASALGNHRLGDAIPAIARDVERRNCLREWDVDITRLYRESQRIVIRQVLALAIVGIREYFEFPGRGRAARYIAENLDCPHVSVQKIGPATEFLSFCSFMALSLFLLPRIDAQQITPAGKQEERGWKLVWSDEFNQPNGSALDASKWVVEVGGQGWGNRELEYYTSRPENLFIRDGALVIEARRENFAIPGGPIQHYTSARLKTAGRFSQQYGRFEARIKIPSGQGMWPAFWMLGDDIDEVAWPACGEIDIMENIGKEPSTIHGSLHGPGYIGDAGIQAPYTLPGKRRFADDFHVFAVEWEPEAIRFYVDDDLYVTRTRADLHPGWKWVFDHPFFLLLNLAVGGSWPGNPDATTVFPQYMLVDYVRVYQRLKP